MWSPPVLMRAVPGEDGPQVPFAEDQDAVGQLGPVADEEPDGGGALLEVYQQVAGLPAGSTLRVGCLVAPRKCA